MAYCGETTIDTKKPDLKQLSCAAGGKLLYDGKEAELRYVMPWYQDMWPDSVSEWGFTIFLWDAKPAHFPAVSTKD